MAVFKCPKNDREFKIITQNGSIHGTNMPYIECCPFCGCDMDGSDVIERK